MIEIKLGSAILYGPELLSTFYKADEYSYPLFQTEQLNMI